MSEYRSVLVPGPSPFQLDRSHRILSIGSCFAERIGVRLERQKFTVHRNPFGILYNPISMQICLSMLLGNHQFGAADIFEHEGRWNSYYHHGKFARTSPSGLLASLQRSLVASRAALLTADRIILTLGTARIHRHKALGEIVANCHRLPRAAFEERRLGPEEIVLTLRPLLQHLATRQPGLQVLLTVSPVRHLRDGLVNNQRSKAALLLAVEQLERELPFAHYFPAYELVTDDLRDYRFFERDLMHPTEWATDYVWERFQQSCFTEPAAALTPQIECLQRAAAHRPVLLHSTAHQRFVRAQLTELETFTAAHPALDFSAERSALERQLI